MTVCAVKSCKNYTDKKDKCKNITFHKFPTDPVAADNWTEIIRQARNERLWKPKPKTSICSAHFHIKDTYMTKTGRRKIRAGAMPTKKLYISSMQSDDEEERSSDDEVLDQTYKEPSASTGRKPDEIDKELSSMYSVFYTVEEVKLKKLLRRERAREIMLLRKVKLLQAKNRRLDKRNAIIKKAITTFKKKKLEKNK